MQCFSFAETKKEKWFGVQPQRKPIMQENPKAEPVKMWWVRTKHKKRIHHVVLKIRTSGEGEGFGRRPFLVPYPCLVLGGLRGSIARGNLLGCFFFFHPSFPIEMKE